MSQHRCHFEGCQTITPRRLLFCPYHWRLVPKEIQETVWQTRKACGRSVRSASPEQLRGYIEATRGAKNAIRKALGEIP